MDSSTSLYDIHRHDRIHSLRNSSQTALMNGMKKSASQAYFDRYPERKGKGPYIPSHSLTTSRSNTKSGESESLETQQGRSCSGSIGELSTSVRFDAITSSENGHTKESSARSRPRPSQRAASSSLIEKQAASTASISYASTFFSGSSPGQAPPRHFTRSRADAAAVVASRSPVAHPSLPLTGHGKPSQSGEVSPDPRADGLSSTSPLDAQGGRMTQHVLLLESPQRRLRPQLSMPNVRTPRREETVPDLPQYPQNPLLVAAASKGQGPKLRSNISPSHNVSSIDDIIRRHSPTVQVPRSASSYSDVFTQSPGRRSMLKKDRTKGGHESDSSLDSIEKEIRSSMRLTASSDDRDSRFAQHSSSEGDTHITTSPSTSAIFGRKKASYSMLNPVKRLQTLSTASSSSAGASEASSSNTRRSSKKYLNLSIPSPSISPSPVQSPSTQSPPASASGYNNELHRYLHSQKLTTLMTLARQPFQGLTISFADVGDPDGHPVFVFLGLGAVRYLVGLYDEMATILRLRLICIDRWGLGKSDDLSAERSGVMEWSNVVVEVADRLQIERFSLLAHSAGTPYAMATCLVHEARIAGPVHLLAPWVGSTVESGYKWLKYVPDGVIKTAQAADWRMQAWKLGLGKSPLVLPSDDPIRSASREGSFSPSSSQRSLDAALLTPPVKQVGLKVSRSVMLEPDTTASSLEANGWTMIAEPETPTNSEDSAAPSALHPNSGYGRRMSSLHASSSHTSELLAQATPFASSQSPSAALTSSSEATQTPSYSVTDLTTALMRASHAETLRGGATNDLLVILGRSSQKPWGFAYTDVSHDVIVWQGDKDERVSLSSIMWMEREMKSCSVNLVKNANHGLMTNVAVVIEALESISAHR